MVKNLPANAGDMLSISRISRLGGSPGTGNGNQFQYSCLEIPMDRRTTGGLQSVYGVAESQTRLSTHIHAQLLKFLQLFIRVMQLTFMQHIFIRNLTLTGCFHRYYIILFL